MMGWHTQSYISVKVREGHGYLDSAAVRLLVSEIISDHTVTHTTI